MIITDSEQLNWKPSQENNFLLISAFLEHFMLQKMDYQIF